LDLRRHVSQLLNPGDLLQFKLGADAIIVCPYHGWAYKLDGGLHAVREMDALESFDPADYGPNPPQLTVFHGLIFINCDDGADSFEPELTIVESPLGAYDLAPGVVFLARSITACRPTKPEPSRSTRQPRPVSNRVA